MDAPGFNGEPDRGLRTGPLRERPFLNCSICGRKTIGHSMPDKDGRNRAVCAQHYSELVAAEMLERRGKTA